MASFTSRGMPLSMISPRYLHTISTIHPGLFSAVAQLIGELQFDFIKDRYDFQIRGNVCKSSIKTNKTQPEDRMSVPKSNYSLRAYSSILYLKPKMQIILQKRKVETCVVSKTLSKVFRYSYNPACVPPLQPIPITFGYNTKTKDHCGLMMYHKNRLIKAYEHVACQRKGGRIGLGVIGVIECNYLTPTLNKQDFDNTKIYRKTMLSVGNKLEKYWKDVKYRYKYCDKSDEDIGRQPDSNWVQCNDCVKWRKLPDGTESSELNKKWFCYMNPDPKFRSCEAKEESEDSENELYYHKIYNKQDESKQTLQDEKTGQQESSILPPCASIIPSSTNTGTSSSDNTSDFSSSSSDNTSDFCDLFSSVVPERKRTAPDLLQENPEKKARVGDYSISDGPTTSTASPYLFPFIPITCFDSIEEDWEKANETEPTASGNDVTDKNSVNKEQINQMTQTSSENKHDYQELYLQVKEEIKQIQHILEEKAKEQEELKGKVDSLKIEKSNLLTCCETLIKDLKEIKRECEIVKVEPKTP